MGIEGGEIAEAVEWLRKSVGMEVAGMMLQAGLPGGTRTQRIKNAAFADGCAHAVKKIIAALESGDWRDPPQGDA